MEKKKKNVGCVVFLILLAILILIPVAAWCYLRFSNFNEERVPLGEETGSASVSREGDLCLSLTPRELLQYYEEDYAATVNEALSGYGLFTVDELDIYPTDGGAVVYADGTALGFITFHLKASADITVKNERAEVTLRSAQLGKWITLPLDKLKIDDHYTAELSRFRDCRIKSLVLGAERSEMVLGDIGLDRAVSALEKELTASSRVWYYLALPDSDVPGELAELGRFVGAGAKISGPLKDIVFKSGDPAAEYLRLLAFVPRETEELSRSRINAFAAERLFSGAAAGTEKAREAHGAQLAALVERYFGFFRGITEDWCELRMTVDAHEITYTESGAKFPETAELPEELFDIEYAGIYMIVSSHTTWPVRWADLPRREALNYSKTAVRNTMYDTSYLGTGICVYVKLPCGRGALLYEQQNGNYVVCGADWNEMTDLLSSFELPLIVDDWITRPPARPAPYPLADGTVLEILMVD